MCGIVGVLGKHEVAPILVDALRRLEYRGYDSAGIATVHDSRLDRRRTVGKISALSDYLVHNPLLGKAGIGHTRWATHGAPTASNAHPHQAGRVAVVHNGIIENYRDLRQELADKGIEFHTETDTETVALWADYEISQGKSAIEAAYSTVAKLEGAFALAFLFEGEDDLMVVTRRGSPLAIGHGEGEMFVGSDAIALATLTHKITYLEEGDFAVLRRQSVEITDADGNELVNRPVTTTSGAANAIDKAGYKHFMAKEIAEQPDVLRSCLREYISGVEFNLPETLDLTRFKRITMVACGTAFVASHVAKYWFEKWIGLPVEVDIASEYRYREPIVEPDTLAICISQSGETADTLAALRYLQGKAAQTLAIVNVEGSSIARESDVVLGIHAGAEIGVASTKAFTGQLCVLGILMLAVMKARKSHPQAVQEALHRQLVDLPELLSEAMTQQDEISQLSLRLAEARDILFLGRGVMYPMALEGALKLKEISYIHAEGYAAGELKHGPIALLDKHVPVIVLAPSGDLFDKTVSNMQEAMARGAQVILITDARGQAAAGDGVTKSLIMPQVDETFAPIVYAVALQLIAYHTAVTKGTDVDQPRNLAKSVTVE